MRWWELGRVGPVGLGEGGWNEDLHVGHRFVRGPPVLGPIKSLSVWAELTGHLFLYYINRESHY